MTAAAFNDRASATIPFPIGAPALRPAFAAIAVGLVLMLPSMIAYGLDERLLKGASVWSKPLKFQISLSLHFLTVALLAGLLSPDAVRSRLFRWTLTAGAFSSIAETLYITLQAARGRASHFNDETVLESVLYNLMGVGAVLIVLASFVAGWLIYRQPSDAARAAPGLRTGAMLGLMLGSLLTLGFGGYLGGLGSHLVGVGSDANGLPIFGWSTTVGDLRVPHFFTTHLMQALPVAGLAADRFAPRQATLAVAAATLLGIASVVATFLQAMAGQPFLAL